jgi:AP-4 complex subunit beta-1
VIPPATMSAPTFFSEMKKGEIAELKTQLRGAAAERDSAKLLATIQKVIAYMTLGIDVSALFSEMIMVLFVSIKLLKWSPFLVDHC